MQIFSDEFPQVLFVLSRLEWLNIMLGRDLEL